MAAFAEIIGHESNQTVPLARNTHHDGLRNLHRDVNRFTNDLILSRARFGGDLDRLLIVLVFMLARIESMQRGNQRGGRIEGLNALSIAEITGLPRETARRKLIAMVDEGELMRGPGGLYSCCGDLESLIDDLRPLMGLRSEA